MIWCFQEYVHFQFNYGSRWLNSKAPICGTRGRGFYSLPGQTKYFLIDRNVFITTGGSVWSLSDRPGSVPGDIPIN